MREEHKIVDTYLASCMLACYFWRRGAPRCDANVRSARTAALASGAPSRRACLRLRSAFLRVNLDNAAKQQVICTYTFTDAARSCMSALLRRRCERCHGNSYWCSSDVKSVMLSASQNSLWHAFLSHCKHQLLALRRLKARNSHYAAVTKIRSS